MKSFAPKLLAAALLSTLLAACDWKPFAQRETLPSGTIETDEAHVASRYGGRVEKIFAQEGDSLATGQSIVQLDAAELRARREQMAALLAELEAGPRKEEIAAAKADWEAISAELELAHADRKRSDELLARKTISETEHDRAVSRANALEKNVAAAKARHDLLLAGTRPERLAQARAQLAETDAQLREMTIAAPTNCVLEVLSVKPGDVLAPNREVATLLLTNHLWVRVFVPQSALGAIKLGDAAGVRADAFPGREFAGAVEQIGRAAEFTPRNVQTAAERIQQVFAVKVRMENPDGQLRAGMSVEVKFKDQ
ncbi:MAG: efflux RND transporter periplasmic adaptor subunit [Verrucomicrobia bacterium]|nr:efflux RND transporter periplasmic adaptor subunit [Verrucomicrobiota bacterium]